MGEGGAGVPEVETSGERDAWLRRPFARTFDLIAGEYGWTDGQILDLTMQRTNQIRSVIWERQAEVHRKDLLVREKELQILAQFIAAAGGHKEGVKAAGKIRLAPPEVDPGTGEVKRQIRPIPYEQAKRWFPDG